ncbi:ornithine cyclodeaminase/mu-crystallin [Pseudomonas aeruginosa]|nr:ornithine cyclodeaminase/mu-crystallin [Pseudomonas aeruginosa]
MSAATPLIVQQAEAEQLLARIDVLQAMRQLFLDLAAGQALQPAQQLVEFPAGRGDFINYLGVLAQEQVYGVKTSPYIVREQGPLVTAWTLLMSMQTGQPLLLCDAARLTTARTAATTAVAVDALAPAEAGRLALIGSGPVAHAHLQYVKGLRDWQGVRVHSPCLDERRLQSLRAIDPRAEAAGSLEEALDEADVILLCTSSARAVIDPRQLKRPALVTSISTNAPRAHEVPAESLAAMDVYCDYRHTTPRLRRRDADRRRTAWLEPRGDPRRPRRTAQRPGATSGIPAPGVLPLDRPGPGRRSPGQRPLPPAPGRLIA